ncbi:Gfo/Idh/MocA family protein [Blastococcus sp. TF02A-26]|uniref:Gfo/Idh/MocA family protein n=1 Tax=Blastococcus sp. TF02A-26 TaxID=2250577 RepID=UPI000DE91A2B|nr:Gfo/Idh/MocA family oxidoreductase [Blastococcus sp. TF02A-26]RBY87376.1 gfo/Idh/MocA family oxidoreductase [Blastococcus sp. TF02A-26]
MTRAAVVGTGAIAETHLACLKSLPDVEVVGVVDLSPARAEATAERFGVRCWYADTGTMLADARPDAVHVTTPPNAHVGIALDALQAGAHVVVEKPVAPTYEGWSRLRDEARSRGLRLIENQNYRFAREVRQVQRLIGGGEFGAVHQIDVRFFQSIAGSNHPFADPFLPHPTLQLPGGPITDFLPHMASLVHEFLGEPTGVHATWLPGEAGRTPVPYVDMVGTVRTDAGLATLSFGSRSGPDGFWVSVFGERAQARINLYEGRLTVDSLRGGPPPLRPLANAVAEARGTVSSAARSLWGKLTSAPGSYEGLWFLLGAFYASLEDGTEPPLSLDDVDATARIVAGLTDQVEELR